MSAGQSFSLDFECWHFAITLFVEKCFLLSFGVGKMKLHHCLPPPWKKSFWPPPVKIHCCSPPGKMLPTPVTTAHTFHVALFPKRRRQVWILHTDEQRATFNKRTLAHNAEHANSTRFGIYIQHDWCTDKDEASTGKKSESRFACDGTAVGRKQKVWPETGLFK